MSADLLREAASLMRSRAEAATPGPWQREPHGYDVYEGQTDHGDVVAEAGLRTADAAHIASWHPAVALAVADLLAFAAPYGDQPSPQSPTVQHAAAIARAYLGAECATCSGRGVWMDEPCSDCGGVA